MAHKEVRRGHAMSVDFGGFRWISMDFCGSGEIWADLGGSGEIWGDLARSGEIWRDVGFRAGMASAAPSVGLRRDHIGFRPLLRIFIKKAGKCI